MDELSDAIRDITQTIFSTVLGLEAQASERRANAPGTRTVAGRVHITGQFEGAVSIHCSGQLARRAAAIMFAVEDSDAEGELAHEVIAELANMAGGNIKALVSDSSQLSLPSVAEGIDLSDGVPGARLVSAVAFECLGEPVLVSLVEADRGS